ncbi:nuclease-related domain-containing DEAD/DEAH box helicase [Saccharopolyspora gregorii]|uniref:nuclease-related domain-containing DEAD/DEAH box helicase n=1 Tax=Saccharopolyspora gregorii TaxID=33914 RepID=UPI0021ABDC13|nr:NERD domain-containing protein [Saccharopolyspora gregorii]
MMPPYCPEDAPPGESAVFEALATSPETGDWIVLHSLAIASHVRQVQGEADFVVVVPNHGVLVIEVKSHSSVKRLPDGRWKLGSQAPTSRGPFQQVNEAMHSIKDYLRSHDVNLRSVPVLDAVWFTHVRARAKLPHNPEWHSWQLLDSEDLKANAAGAVSRALAAGTEHLGSRIRGFTPGAVGLDEDTANRIASVLRPKFEAAIVPGDIRRVRENQLAAFIDEQYDALDSMQHNRAVMFSGPAGCGKTWLAMEAARREIELGRTGRLICFNRLLGQRLKREMADIEGLRVGTFHQEALRLSGVQTPIETGPQFWETQLPDLTVEALLDHGETEAADFLIVDEVQDLARNPMLDVLDLLVKDGLKGGRVVLFGDFERQAIYESGDGRALLSERIHGLATFALNVNCRNLPRIGTVVKKLSHMVPGYRRFRRPDDGVDPEFIPVQRGQDQSTLLADAVRTLREDGFGLDEMIVLSPLRSGSTAETTKDQWLRQILRPADGQAPRSSQLRFSTIHAFKGLESPAVIITDLDEGAGLNFEALLYVGMTRATDRLVALIETQTFRATYGGKP